MVPLSMHSICHQNDNYTKNSTYERNLDNALLTLPTTDSGLGFFNISVGQGTDRVHSYALCRGDIKHDLCHRCVIDAINNIREDSQIQKVRVFYQPECWLTYFDKRLPSYVYIVGSSTITAPEPNIFEVAVRSLLGELFKEAANGGSLRKFAIGKTAGPSSLTIYGFAQCTPYLTKEQCIKCLKNEIPKFLEFAPRASFKKIDGIFYGVPCNFGYNISPLSTMLM
ncbi:hypothetical protein QVD17_09317 [Tagetes erecta]|uniref:Gnk2-homologous domain-containing protein n=1 Tax=Tagetes erecta TaxID=13708 RepID=A0AAD8P574_TARER|nr:hypothetical protein QVD17_09317 [Tagetes erecta]